MTENENKRTLHLPLIGKWYDMIDKGEKKEEYRDLKAFWIKRLCEGDDTNRIKQFDEVKFSYGYTTRTMTFRCEGITIGNGKPEWGAEDGERYFVIKLGERIK